MTAWTDQLLPASFRGVQFQVDRYSVSFGRRADMYELERTTQAQDLGLVARRFQISGFVLGDTAVDQARALQGALETAGPGRLTHPLYGERTVQIVGTASVSGQRDQYGRLALSFEAVEVNPDPILPTADFNAAVTLATIAVRAAVGADFLARFDALGDFVDGVLTKAEAAVDEVFEQLDTIASAIDGARAVVARIAELRADALALVSAPAGLVAALEGLLDDIAALGDTDPFARALATTTPPDDLDTSGATESDRQAAENAFVLRQLYTADLYAMLAGLLPSFTFASWDLALDVRDQLTDAIAAEEEIAPPDVAAAYIDLRTAIVDTISALAGDLVPLQTIEILDPEPAIVLAARLYDDPLRASEVAEANDVDDPGAILGVLRVPVS